MRRRVTVTGPVLALASALALSACGGGGSGATASSATAATSSPSAAVAAHPCTLLSVEEVSAVFPVSAGTEDGTSCVWAGKSDPAVYSVTLSVEDLPAGTDATQLVATLRADPTGQPVDIGDGAVVARAGANPRYSRVVAIIGTRVVSVVATGLTKTGAAPTGPTFAYDAAVPLARTVVGRV